MEKLEEESEPNLLLWKAEGNDGADVRRGGQIHRGTREGMQKRGTHRYQEPPGR